MYSDDDFLPLSGLQHMVYCERQAALIHIDRVWVDNALTIEGTDLHRNVDEGRPRVRDGVRVLRSVPLRSERLGLVGKADVVELQPASNDSPAAVIPELGAGLWKVVPVEYKRGRPKAHEADEVQLCAQAVCLEEMFGVGVPCGFLYYGKQRRRTEVEFDEDLRGYTVRVARAFHELVRSGKVPVRARDARCERCSLLGVCMPPRRGWPTSARRYLYEWLEDETGDPPQ